MKSTPLIDCHTGAILGVHCSMSLPHDTQIGWQVLSRNLSDLETVVADKRFDWDDLRQMLRDEGVKPVMKHREFYLLDAAHNARMNDETYHHRFVVESIFFALRERYDTQLKPRTWFGQFREIVRMAAIRNLEHSLNV